jgi:hypothetical protein
MVVVVLVTVVLVTVVMMAVVTVVVGGGGGGVGNSTEVKRGKGRRTMQGATSGGDNSYSETNGLDCMWNKKGRF